ncbi:uncharacterized protein [Palaemon carinicauda]|uniref:uncharacterized protein n=1 Tax=Palaemon carinicauda TaxID=392227 RepID=UPI0035B5EC22
MMTQLAMGPIKNIIFLLIWSTVISTSSSGYVADSILCDDIPAICSNADIPYERDNDTICGTQVQYLNPAVCNCGHKCMGSIDEGEGCSTSSVMMFPEEVCGNQLECISSETSGKNAKCSLNPEHECIAFAMQYDKDMAEGTVGPGQYRANCNDDGSYAGRQCSPGSTCYCVDKNNIRLFGEEASTKFDEMDCECANYWSDTQTKGLTEGLRCLINGNFDPLLCVDGYCYCYNHAKGTIDGPYDQSMLLNINCYDSSIHNPNYINICHQAQIDWDSRSDNETILIDHQRRPACDHSGHYAPVQITGPYAYCVNPYGDRIENFTAPLYSADDITCNCARRRYFMDTSGLGASKPKCCPNGEYFPYQTRGLLAYCVDRNGNQQGEAKPITDIESLIPTCNYVPPCQDEEDFSYII